MRFITVLLWRLPILGRRILLFGAAGLLLALGVLKFSGGLFYGPADMLTCALCALYVELAAFAALAWMLRIFGFLVGVGHLGEEADAGAPTTRTAIVMPIYHEDVERVAWGIERTWLSAKASGLDEVCDYFVLSDSTDKAIQAEEQQACAALLRHFDHNRGNSGRLFLVRRAERKDNKAGNIANFLRIHGADYEFMLVLDADSAMTGQRIRRLIRKLERHPRTALVQSLMTIYRARTLFARIMQSNQNPQSTLYSSGLRWLLGSEGIYWGHNALMRIRPFAEHAMLPVYPWAPPQGGPVLSQDVHEASLLGRAGWDVDLDLDEGGSFEEMPANILSNAERDRRWCQGDFLNLVLVFCGEIRTGQRMWLFYIFSGYFMSLPVIGIMLLGSFDACRRSAGGEIGAGWLVLLNIYLLQLVPKALAFVRSQLMRGRVRYGAVSFALDTVGSILFGPLMLYLHGRIVLGILCGQARPWKSPSRNPRDSLSWAQAAAVFWPPTTASLIWIAILVAKAPTYLAFCGPVLAVWGLSIPIAVVSSWVGLADWLARLGWMRAEFSADEAQALGPLVLEADRTSAVEESTGDVRESLCQETDRLVACPSANPVELGKTEVQIAAIGRASTNLADVAPGFISAQRLMLLLWLSGALLLALVRYGIGR
jgi:membrane glycosyltransferase